MPAKKPDSAALDKATATVAVVAEVRRQLVLLKTGALQDAILNSANFSIIATDEKGIIQLFNTGKAGMKRQDEIGNLAADFGSMAAELKDNQDKLVSYGRELEAAISERTAELAHEKANLESSVAERTTQLNAVNVEPHLRAPDIMQRTRAPLC